MTIAAARVETRIIIGADDRASTALKQVQAQLGKASAKIKAASKSSSAFGTSFDRATGKANKLGASLRSMVSGDVTGALSSVSGLLGSGGIAGSAALAATASVALAAGVGLAAKKFTEWSVEIERSRAALDATFGAGEGVAQVTALAQAIGGVGVESVAQLATTLKATGINASITTAQLQELTARATQMGKSGDEALSAFAAAIRKGNTAALKQVGVFINASKAMKDYGDSIGVTAENMTDAQKQTAVMVAIQADLETKMGATSTEFARQDALLARLDVAWSTLRFGVSEYLSGPGSNILANLVETAEAMARFGRVTASVVEFLGTAALAQFRAVGTVIGGIASAAAIAVQGGSLKQIGEHLKTVAKDTYATTITSTADAFKRMTDEFAAAGRSTRVAADGINLVGNAFASLAGPVGAANNVVKQSAKVAADAAKRRTKALQAAAKAEAAAAKARAERAKVAAYGVRQAEAGARALFEYARQDLATEALIAKARQATAVGTRARIDAERELIDIATRRQIVDVEAEKGLTVADKEARIKAIEALARAELTARIKAIHETSAAVIKAQDEARRREAEAARARIAESAAYVGQIAGTLDGDFAQAATSAASAVQKIAGSWQGLAKSAPDTITAVGSIATAFVDGEREKSAILAITEGAAALASIATQDYAGAAAHGGAAVLYGLAAGGVIGGGGAAPAQPAGAPVARTGGEFAPAAGPAGAAPAPGGNTYIFAGITETRHQLAKKLKRDRRTLVGTGV